MDQTELGVRAVLIGPLTFVALSRCCNVDQEYFVDSLIRGVYPYHIGPGVYDIHSPVIPTKEQFLSRIADLVKTFPEKQLWVNPDCGLKTRRWEEALPALKNMVDAVKVLRGNFTDS